MIHFLHFLHIVFSFLIHHWSLVVVAGFILFSLIGVILEMVFNGGPLDHDEDTWGSPD